MPRWLAALAVLAAVGIAVSQAAPDRSGAGDVASTRPTDGVGGAETDGSGGREGCGDCAESGAGDRCADCDGCDGCQGSGHADQCGECRVTNGSDFHAGADGNHDKALLEHAAGDLLSSTVTSAGDRDFTVTFLIDESFGEGLTRAGLARDVYDFLRDARDSGAAFNEVTLLGSLPATDKYGRVRLGPAVFRATFDRLTVHKIAYGNIDRGELDHMRRLTVGRMVVKQPIRDDSWAWS